MTDFSASLAPATPTRPSLRQAFGVDVPTIEICDVGAMIEDVERYAGLVAQGVANVNGFEPNPAQFARLQAARKPRSRYFQAFLGDGGSAQFHMARFPGCSSLYKADPSMIDLFSAIGASTGGNFTVVATDQVQTTRLDDVTELPEIDYIKLDIQGSELNVLKHAGKVLKSALVIESEVMLIPLYENQPLLGDIQVFLRDHGFLLHKLIDIAGRAFRPFKGPGGNPFAAISQVLWADAIFVRDFSQLHRFSEAQLLKSAAILSQAYDSHDLVHYLLREYDRRRQTRTAQQYLNTVMSSPNVQTQYMNLKVRP